MKLLDGDWAWGETVTIEVNGKTIKRRVHYGSLDGLYVVIDGEKVGRNAMTREEENN